MNPKNASNCSLIEDLVIHVDQDLCSSDEEEEKGTSIPGYCSNWFAKLFEKTEDNKYLNLSMVYFHINTRTRSGCKRPF